MPKRTRQLEGRSLEQRVVDTLIAEKFQDPELRRLCAEVGRNLNDDLLDIPPMQALNLVVNVIGMLYTVSGASSIYADRERAKCRSLTRIMREQLEEKRKKG